MKHVNVLLFDNFTTLDALGPTEVFCRLDNYFKVGYFSINGGLIKSSTNNDIVTKKINEIEENNIFVIPGGFGTRELILDTGCIDKIKEIAVASEYVLCICTGSVLLAKTGLLNSKKATSNKKAWEWVVDQNNKVNWIKKARWVIDGKYYTSSGITAGIDMTLGFIKDIINHQTAKTISNALEYVWNENSEYDPFYKD